MFRKLREIQRLTRNCQQKDVISNDSIKDDLKGKIWDYVGMRIA